MFSGWQLQKLMGVPVADIFDQAAQKYFIVGEFITRHVPANQIA